jgi:anti-anti-sigma regulatory factor
MHPTSPSATFRWSRDPLAYTAGDCTVIAAYGRIDSAGYLALEHLAAAALEGGCTRLVFDLYEVSDIDPAALDLLRAGLRGNRLSGATLAIAGVRPSVALALKELDSEGISIHSNVRAALAPVSVGGPR